MAISSIHIEAGSGGFFAHNSREASTNNSIFKDEENYCSCNKKEAFEFFRREIEKRKNVYTKKTKQKVQKSTKLHLSAIVNFNKDHTPDDIQKVCDYLEEKLDTKIIQFAMHRDEGHTHKDTVIKNYHAHIEFLGLDSEGKSIRKKLDKPFLKQAQTDVAMILEMERGNESGYSKEVYREIQKKLKPLAEYSNKKDYNQEFKRVAEELGYGKKTKPKKRLDTYDYKDFARSAALARNKDAAKYEKKFHDLKVESVVAQNDLDEAKSKLAKQKDLKNELTKLRSELQQAKADRSQYAELEKINRELKLKIKNKDLSIDELKELLSIERFKSLPEIKIKQGEINEHANNIRKSTIEKLRERTETENYDNMRILSECAMDAEKQPNMLLFEHKKLFLDAGDANRANHSMRRTDSSHIRNNEKTEEERARIEREKRDAYYSGLKKENEANKQRINELEAQLLEMDEKTSSRPNMNDYERVRKSLKVRIENENKLRDELGITNNEENIQEKSDFKANQGTLFNWLLKTFKDFKDLIMDMQNRIFKLEKRVKKLETENYHLQKENHDLKLKELEKLTTSNSNLNIEKNIQSQELQ